ncbi:MAG TPA: hypothetical protein DCZ10_08845 [Pelotomaculum sp.]|nr:hypothetical protein [Pelotomaculum sp.]
MQKEELLACTNAKLQHLLETVLDYVVLLTEGDTQKFETFRRVLLNKYNALKKANIADFATWGEKYGE